MSTYRRRTQPKPTTAAGLRAQASANGNSIFRNRPRSIAGLFSPNQNSYSSLLGIGPTNTSSYITPSFLSKSKSAGNNFLKNTYSSSANNLNYPNPYTTYGGTSSGYGGLSVPQSSPLATPSTSYNYLNHSSNNLNSRPSIHRGGSFNKSKPKTETCFGSRSSSLQSLASSEGYIVRLRVLRSRRSEESLNNCFFFLTERT